MLTVLKRQEAIKLASFVQMFSLSPKEREVKIEDAFAEFGIADVSEAEANVYLRKYFKIEMSLVTNSYLQEVLSEQLSITVKIVGKEPSLHRCYCCGYKTLEERGGYDICEVCYWEDTGNHDDEKYSSPNHMTLNEGKRNYREFGASKERYLKFLDKKRFRKYDK